MKILIVSSKGKALSVAWRMTKEGHDVKLYIDQLTYKSAGDGFVKKVKDWLEWVSWPDLIVVDDFYGDYPNIPVFWLSTDSKCPDSTPTFVYDRPDGTSFVSAPGANPEAVAVTLGGFSDSSSFLNPLSLSFPAEKLMAGDVGPAAFMGSSMVWIHKERKIAEYLRPFEYAGHVNCRLEIFEDKCQLIESHCEFNAPLMLETIKENIGQLFFDIASSTSSKRNTFTVSNPYAVSVLMAVPPYPTPPNLEAKTIYEGRAVEFKAKKRDGFWPNQMRRDDKNKWISTGPTGEQLTVTGQGVTVPEAMESAYKRTSGVKINAGMYRTDIGVTMAFDLAKLKSWGWFEARKETLAV